MLIRVYKIMSFAKLSIAVVLLKMYKQLFVVFALAAALRGCQGHSYSLGSCPNIDPMPQFNMDKMLGVWYVIQKTSTASTCITYNFTSISWQPQNYDLEQTSQHAILGLTPLAHEYHYSGHLSVPDTAVPARMNVEFRLNVLGKASFTVFMTDYDTYAAVFTCQGLAIGHRQSATILSRERSLDKVFIDKIRTRLASYNIDPFDLSIISQKNCPKNKNGTNDDIFSAQSVTDADRWAGKKLEDGIDYVAGGAKQVYNNYAGTTDAQYIADGSKRTYNNAREYVQQVNNKIQDGVEYVAGGVRRTYADMVSGGSTEHNASVWLP